MYMYLGPCAHFLADMNDVVVFSTYLNIHVHTFKKVTTGLPTTIIHGDVTPLSIVSRV